MTEIQAHPPYGSIKGRWVCPQCQYPLDWEMHGDDYAGDTPLKRILPELAPHEAKAFFEGEHRAFLRAVQEEISKHRCAA